MNEIDKTLFKVWVCLLLILGIFYILTGIGINLPIFFNYLISFVELVFNIITYPLLLYLLIKFIIIKIKKK